MTKYENDPFGTRMKQYEREFAFNIEHKLVKMDLKIFDGVELKERGEDTLFPYMRIDGRSFSRFTKKLVSAGLIKKPRDEVFEGVLVRATVDTVKEFNLLLGFHQSDEISLYFKPIGIGSNSQTLFDGKIQKLLSVVPSFFTNRFCYHFAKTYHCDVPPCSFDARVCVFPSMAEATNMLVWRWQDATRNLIQDIAHFKFGAKRLDGVSTQEKFEMIGSPEIRGGNFIKRVSYKFDTPYTGPFNMQETVTRHKVIQLTGPEYGIDFQTMTFDERMALIYGEETNNG